MRKRIELITVVILSAACIFSACENCDQRNLDELGLSSWKDTLITNPDEFSIYSIVDFVNSVTCEGTEDYVRVEDRIAVFDMDGTIACERPLSMEMLCGYFLAYNSLPDCNITEIDSLTKVDIEKIIYEKHFYSEYFVERSKGLSDSLINTCIPADTLNHTSRYLCKQFYKPMIELIHFLKSRKFEVYIVSGSEQQFIWGVIENVDELDFDRQHIIGSLTKYESIDYSQGGGTKFYMSKEILLSNSSKGKSTNIYNRINKTPIFAFGNTVNDFDMFAFTSSNKYPNIMCVLLNHDSDNYEAAYEPFNEKNKVKKNWNDKQYINFSWTGDIFNDIMQKNNWHRMDMSKVFKKDSVFIK